MLKHFYKIIILGSAWGIIEATLGYFLHMFGVGIGWVLWFPVAFFFINKAYHWTESFSCTMMTAAIASSLKLINLFFPNRIDMVINPAVSIILEAVSVVLVYQFIFANGKREKLHLFDIVLIGFAWRMLYLSYVFLLPEDLLQISPAATSLSFVRFMVFENAVNTVVIYMGLLIAEKLRYLSFNRLLSWIDGITARKRLLRLALCCFTFAAAVIIKLVTV